MQENGTDEECYFHLKRIRSNVITKLLKNIIGNEIKEKNAFAQNECNDSHEVHKRMRLCAKK